MPFSLRSSLATASYCFWRSGIGFVWPRWVIQPVPVYSQYMSISPDSSAFRAATVPARPVWSFTVAPAFSRTCSVIWPEDQLLGELLGADGELGVRRGLPPPEVPATATAATRDQGQDGDEPQQLRVALPLRSHSDPPSGSWLNRASRWYMATDPWDAGCPRPRRPASR